MTGEMEISPTKPGDFFFKVFRGFFQVGDGGAGSGLGNSGLRGHF